MPTLKKIFFILLQTTIILPLITVPLNTVQAGAIDDGTIQNPECRQLGIECGGTFATISNKGITYINAFLGLAAVVAFGALIYGAFLYVTSRGDEAQSRQAKLTIVYALVGLAILGIAGALVNATINLLPK